ncbi:prolipoprotein diacylglyceryl transferase [Magnetovibrio sp. PR-2]|uniref:prolipoprotein diacylglyceryl transferase n=1 Tax=Magnetovibrio sp. PR-2 TaxID=3120356 RepID=UPI002FCE1DD8
MPFPDIDPIIFQIGPIAIRWYSMAYIAGLLIGLMYLKQLMRKFDFSISVEKIDDFLIWAIVGVILGGRLGYVIFYQLDFYLDNPIAIVQTWKGGMSFHGGLLGVAIATVVFAKRHGLPILLISDLVAVAAPIGLFFGRLANFINGELYGRTTDVSWGVVFPHGGPLPRHPSQLYEAALEGIVLFLILNVMLRFPEIRRRKGILAGVFLIGYGLARSIVELFRQPDEHIGFLIGGTTLGQWLSMPLILVGIILISLALRETRTQQGRTLF